MTPTPIGAPDVEPVATLDVDGMRALPLTLAAKVNQWANATGPAIRSVDLLDADDLTAVRITSYDLDDDGHLRFRVDTLEPDRALTVTETIVAPEPFPADVAALLIARSGS